MTDDQHPGSGFNAVALFAADHAAVVDGKLYVNGGFWTRLRFPAYPAALASISLVAVIDVPFSKYHADHKFTFGFEDCDRKSLGLRVEGEFRVGASQEMEFGDPTLMPIVAQVANFSIESPGDYAFTFEVDGAPLARYPIRAMQVAVPMKLIRGDNEPPGPFDAAE